MHELCQFCNDAPPAALSVECAAGPVALCAGCWRFYVRGRRGAPDTALDVFDRVLEGMQRDA